MSRPVIIYWLVIEYPEGSREDRWPEPNWEPPGSDGAP